MGACVGFIMFRIRKSNGDFWRRQRNFRLNKTHEISWAASKEGFCSTEIIVIIIIVIKV
jgi:hypothetical protein